METFTSRAWDGLVQDPRFQHLQRRKHRTLWGLMALSVAYFLLLPIGAGYFQAVFKVRVWGPVNIGLLFALSEFLAVWVIALLYSQRARRDFDRMAESLAADFTLAQAALNGQPAVEEKRA